MGGATDDAFDEIKAKCKWDQGLRARRRAVPPQSAGLELRRLGHSLFRSGQANEKVRA
jgi:hypothetical protein